jgi:GT2 family glycosyltransferase
MNERVLLRNGTTSACNLKISVVVATFNRRELLKRLLESLFQQTLSPTTFEVIIVSDGSTDGTIEMLYSFEKTFSNLKILNSKNRGPGAARNAGARIARGRYLAFTDDDCIATAGWLEQLICTFEKSGAVAVQGRTTTDRSTCSPLTHQLEVLSDWTSIMPTCNAAYLRSTFNAVEGFDESFRFLNEDVDLVWRVQELGKVVFEPSAHIVHPPRRDPFWKCACWVRVFDGEFLLYYKSQNKYQKYKGWSPWWTIYWKIFVINQFRLAKSCCKYLIHPFKPQYFFMGIALVIARWFNLIRFFRIYYKAWNIYR